MPLIDRTKKHFWVPSLCACHPQACAQLVTESEKGRVPWYDLCGLPATDKIHKARKPPDPRDGVRREEEIIHG